MMDWPLFSERYRELIPNFSEFLSSLEKPFPIGLRENPLSCLPYGLEEKLKKMNCDYNRPILELDYFEVPGPRKNWGGDIDHHLGLYFMQALSSLMAPLALALRPGSMVLDMCAAPGGKTTHLCGIMENKGTLVATEPDLNRRRILKGNLTRLASFNTAIYPFKGQDLPFNNESFDCILLDGPCSSEGTFRTDVINGSKRRKNNYLEYNRYFRESLHKEQIELIEKSYKLLKKGGTLVYSTCTYDPQENEEVVMHALQKFSDLSLVPIELGFHLDVCPGVTQYNGQSYCEEMALTARLYPHFINSIGFYVAKFIKR
ncbi:MAG: RsmB/NOP family class I SAM-dependent RNA methyltransferase [Bacteriovoracaceae bacterium]|nr:RsmB/NOP family class I SAM-dependent RNA methyltransferase [Bacteriovoracaceae bacterium]